MFGFLSEHIQKGLLKDLFTQFDEDQEDKLNKTLFEVMQAYIQLYHNLEIRVVDMLQTRQFDAAEALDIMVSYSISEEGTNNMYIQLIQTMLALRDPSNYNLVEIEMILNYFPHGVWSTEEDLKPLREKFYFPLLQAIVDNLDTMPDRQFISIF